MKELKNWIEKFIQENKNTILQYYSKSQSYFIDLIISKGVSINSQINTNLIEETKNEIFLMINAINSGLITIGISPDLLKNASDIYDTYLSVNIENYRSYLEFFNIFFKNYINKFLFNILLEFLTEIDLKKMQNLDLFDLIPHKFLKKLNTYKIKNPISEESLKFVKIFIHQCADFFNPTELLFLDEDFDIEKTRATLNESDLLNDLKLAKEKSLEILTNDKLGLKELKSEKSPTYVGTSNFVSTEEFRLLNYFENFPKLANNFSHKFNINFNNLDEIIKGNYKLFDLESLFYAVSIYKILNRKFPITTDLIQSATRNYINGKIFSTGKYHIPNPISIFYGIALFCQLSILQNSNLIDMLDIEMSLEKELSYFNPQNSYLNFFIIMSLKLLKISGGIIKSKDYLLTPLTKFNIENIDIFKPYNDLFFYIASIKALDSDYYLETLPLKYEKLLDESILTNYSINNNITETSRTILIYRMLDSKKYSERINSLLSFIIKHLSFFIENENNKFNWKNDYLALKVELRMLFWALLAFL